MRARNLHRAAALLRDRMGGELPRTVGALRALPGVGEYTAGAIASIAFGQPVAAVDGNVRRVLSRLCDEPDPTPAWLRTGAAALVDPDRPGDFNQALMDLGATVCRPKSPLCGSCPVSGQCFGLASGAPDRYPVKAKKAARPHRLGVVYVIFDAQGRVALERRPDKGLLGGMMGLPTGDWTTASPPDRPPVAGDWREAGAVEHVFTHFSLTLHVRTATVPADENAYLWTPLEQARDALPTVFAKALDRAGAPDLF